MTEQVAKALFEAIFRPSVVVERLDGNHRWDTAEERVKDGFRSEAEAALWAAGGCP